MSATSQQKRYAYELHKPARKRYPRRRTISLHQNDLWQADLCDMGAEFSPKRNSNYRYILMVIDTFTRYAFARPLRNKTGPQVSMAFRDIMRESGAPPINLQTDNGTEFYNAHFNKMTGEYSINHYSTFSEVKAAIVERLNRTVKGIMWRKLTELGTNRWVELLPESISEYNGKIHQTLGMSPNAARLPENEHLIRIQLAVSKTDITKPKFRTGDKVRISKNKGVFDKGYRASWSKEIFTIAEVKNTAPRTYRLQDISGQIVKGSFYKHELQKTELEDYYQIEKILRRRKRRGKEELFVKWDGFDSRHNSWIPAEDAVATLE